MHKTLLLQINVRIDGTCIDDYNVYRRYSEVLRWHRRTAKQDDYFGKTFKPPPKKRIGRKVNIFVGLLSTTSSQDKAFVEERRHALEAYLHDTINYIVNTYPEFATVPLDRRSLQQNIELIQQREHEL